MSGNDLILVINPGSTSTKIALFNKENPIITDNLFHSLEEINKYDSIYEQKVWEKNNNEMARREGCGFK